VLAVALTPLLLPLVGGSWRWILFVWGLPLVAISLVVIRFAPETP